MSSPERSGVGSQPQDGAELLTFCAQEISGFFGYLSTAIASYGLEGGKLPAAKYAGAAKPGPGRKAGAKRQASDKPKAPREPTAYNVFVRRKLAELKAAGDGQEGKGKLLDCLCSGLGSPRPRLRHT